MCNLLGRARTTIYDNCEKLWKIGLIRKFTKGLGTGTNGRGRPPVYWGEKKDESANN